MLLNEFGKFFWVWDLGLRVRDVVLAFVGVEDLVVGGFFRGIGVKRVEDIVLEIIM